MNKFLATLALLVAMAMPAFAQQAGRLLLMTSANSTSTTPSG